jgi:DNA-binding response OmpR family regulator
MLILVVSDDAHLRAEAEFAFPPDVELVFAQGSDDAWPILLERDIAAVIADLRAGNAGGFNLLSRMHQYADLRDIPSLLLLDRDQDHWLGKQAGATACRTKPLEASDLAAETLALV